MSCHDHEPPNVYFFVSGKEGDLQEDVISLAEGLLDLGVPFYSNKDYWLVKPEGPFLLRHDPSVSPQDCDIVVVSYTFPLAACPGEGAGALAANRTRN